MKHPEVMTKSEGTPSFEIDSYRLYELAEGVYRLTFQTPFKWQCYQEGGCFDVLFPYCSDGAHNDWDEIHALEENIGEFEIGIKSDEPMSRYVKQNKNDFEIIYIAHRLITEKIKEAVS